MFTFMNLANKHYPISTNLTNKALILYKFLLRECEKLPEAPQKHYKFMVKQSFKQHRKETDQERIRQIMQRAREDAGWILKKVVSTRKEMMLVPLASSGGPVPHRYFYHAAKVYHDRPHLVNKKLCGASTLFYYNVTFDSTSKLTELINYTSLTYETNKILGNNYTTETLKHLLSDLLLPYDKNLKLDEITQTEFKFSCKGIVITVRILLPKNECSSNTVEVVIFNYDQNYIQFLAASTNDKYTLVAPPFAYKFKMQSGMLQLIVDVADADTANGEWLADKLFPKILKWCEGSDEDRVIVESLGLIAVDKYFEVYRQLKDKYGKKMIEIWPESTDPLKFVYEDVAIATYLICLWDKACESSKKPSFVDLGCGNGLLVYILSQEGYPGLGIDVRKRKIWDLYPESTKLEVKTVVPSDANLFPDADWIIGNHSDELTPWIPVIAARSSPKTNFFLLPCCCYNFDGTKYRRKNTGVSQYAEYLEYVAEICHLCGFDTKIDRLRIPSTKRTCLVGSGAKLFLNEVINTNINNILCNSMQEHTGSTEIVKNQWIEFYQARESKEKVRNCTQLDRSFVSNIISKLVNSLLSQSSETNVLLMKIDGTVWNAGASLEINVLVKTLEAHELKQLKNECGGLQTLMRNHRYIFDVAKGCVKLRPPYLRADTIKYLDKPCWFLINHPDGCLYDDKICAYRHN